MPDVDALAGFHPLVQRWFTESFGEPSAPQRAGWPTIASGVDTLILAPTGSGKTLAAFLYGLDALIREGQSQPLANAVHLLYVSPLKALSNDVHRNLERPLAALHARFRAAGVDFPDIRVAVRTGDTTPAARARMVRTTPHILITTPESLHLLLTSVRGRTMFSALRAVIVDEIHSVAGTKRGAHLALTLERLAHVAPSAPQRIGLSATQRPLDEIARFLGGCVPVSEARAQFRPVEIVDCGLVKTMDARVVSPVEDLAHVDGSIWHAVVPLVLERIRGARTTLVFVNNRGQAERIAARVNAAAGEEIALPYHGSLSRERRFLLEEQLKAGALRALVTTSSLELGIDVGSVDLVVQLQSPKRVTAALQRVGRAGHTLGAVSRGVFVPTFRDDALEQMTIVHAMQSGDVEPTQVVQNALDVLAQLIVAIVASETPEWTATALYDFVRRAYPYHALTRNAFDETLAMVAGRYPSDVSAELDARVHWDRVTDTLTPARSARMVATISGGTIPDRGLYAVYLGDRTRLGELDEEFVHESRVGDAFQLGSSTWRIQAIEHDRIIVAPAPGAPARMPFWHGEFMARSNHLTPAVGALRRALGEATTDAAVAEIGRAYHADAATVTSLAAYLATQREATGIIPDDRHLVLEHFRDEVGSVRMVLHAPFGGRVNAPWGMALARCARERLGVEVQVQTTDDGLMLRLPNLGSAVPVDLVRALSAEGAAQLVLDEVGASSLFGARFRMNAARALLLPRGNPRKRMPLWLQRLKAADLLQAVREFPAFPIVIETYRDVLQDAFDMTGLRDVLDRVASGALPIHVVQTSQPSPFAQSLQFGFVIDWMYGDDTPRAESRAALLSLDRALLDELMGGEGADDATLAVLGDVLARRRGTAPGRQARDADELAVLIDRAGDVTAAELRTRIAPDAEWTRGDPALALLENGRMVGIELQHERRFILVEAYARYAAAFSSESLDVVAQGADLTNVAASIAIPAALRSDAMPAQVACREILGRYVTLAGPVDVDSVCARYPLDPDWVGEQLQRWEQDGRLVRGVFGGDRLTPRWCSRRLLERARRRELAEARAQIAAVAIDTFADFMLRWQHVAPGTHVTGADALETALSQLYGAGRPALAWERHYLPARLDAYDPRALDALLATGEVSWAITPPVRGSAGLLRFFERGTGRLWLSPAVDDTVLSDAAGIVLRVLREQGASFLDDLAATTEFGANRLRDALHELTMAGFVTNDTAAGMRDVLRWQRVFPMVAADAVDPARWLPDSFVVQRRVSPRRLARWRRPDLPGTPRWGGRWSVAQTLGAMGPLRDEADMAEAIARQWLARYGVVSRDWWRRERPAVPWRMIYRELKRLEFRGEVQRGYFVAALAGAQFALPEAVELLRVSGNADSSDPIAIAASDPANAHALPVADDADHDALARPRGAGAVLVVAGGRVMLTVEGRGKRIAIRRDIAAGQLRSSVDAWLRHVVPRSPERRHGLIVETINGELATGSAHVQALLDAGFRRQPGGLRYDAPLR